MSTTSSAIVRSPRESWTYKPDWRGQVIEKGVAELALAPNRSWALQQFVDGERDPFIRQAVHYRLTGACVCRPAFVWAYQALNENAVSSVASIVKAMCVAGLSIDQIAHEIGTDRRNVAVFRALFWALPNNPMRICELAASDFLPPAQTLAETRERLLLRTAYHRGWRGLRALLHGRADNEGEEMDEIAREVERISGRRALRYLEALNAGGVPVGEDDLRRYLAVRMLRTRESLTNEDEMQAKMRNLGEAMRQMMLRDCTPEQAKQLHEIPALGYEDIYREDLALPSAEQDAEAGAQIERQEV